MALFVWYPKCSTCRKAEAWLKEHGVSFTARHIVEENPTAQELAAWKEQGKLPLKSFSMNLKERLPGMSEEEQLALLATDGMLVKRPILVLEDRVLTGFRPEKWAEALGL